mgnify:CR=1 FL=1
MLTHSGVLSFYCPTLPPRGHKIYLSLKRYIWDVYILNCRDLARIKLESNFIGLVHNKGMTSNTKILQSFPLGQSKSNEQCSYEYRRNQRYYLTLNPSNFFRKRPQRRCNHSIIIISHQSPSRIKHSIRKKIRNLQ